MWIKRDAILSINLKSRGQLIEIGPEMFRFDVIWGEFFNKTVRVKPHMCVDSKYEKY
jgi:hypothetical protein